MKRQVCILIFLFVLFLPENLFGGNTAYRSDRLEKIASLVGKSTSWNGFPLCVIENEGTVEHIGYRFFSDEEREAIGKEISCFVERYALECDLPLEREKSIEMQILEDGIVFRRGNLESLKTLCSAPHGELELHNLSEQRYLFQWKDGEMLFPSDVELILGRNQIENGKRLPSEIVSSVFKGGATLPGRDNMVQREDGILVFPGKSYYISSLSSDTYFNGNGLPVNDILHENETLANIFSGLVRDTEISLETRMNVYGLSQEHFCCRLASLVAYALKNNCEPYVGIIARDKEAVELLVIYRNISAAYNHVLRVQIPHTVICDGKGIATARLTPFVPTHSVKYLFEEIRQ